MRRPFLPLLLALAALSGCDDPPKKPAQPEAVPDAVGAEVRRAAEEQVRGRLRIVGEMRLRAVQVYRQQLAGTYAVCGQINPTGAVSDPFIPWVSTVAVENGRASRATLVIGLSNAEASRVYLEMVERCFEGGGPRSAQAPMPGGLPPLPADTALDRMAAPPVAAPPVASPAAPPVAAAPRLPAEGGTSVAPGPGTVTTSPAHPVNIRSAPGGGGSIVRIVPRASVLRVFGEAPGGWYQVGEDGPLGWVHESVLSR